MNITLIVLKVIGFIAISVVIIYSIVFFIGEEIKFLDRFFNKYWRR